MGESNFKLNYLSFEGRLNDVMNGISHFWITNFLFAFLRFEVIYEYFIISTILAEPLYILAKHFKFDLKCSTLI